jgi:hypothetical protein
VLHTDHGVPLTLGDDVTVGHQVMLHGCTIGDNSLIGIQRCRAQRRAHRPQLPRGRGLAGDRRQGVPRRRDDHGQAGQGGAPLTPEQIAPEVEQSRALCRQRAPSATVEKATRADLRGCIELHKFLFDGLPVRGMLVRLTDSWQEVLRRREANSDRRLPATGAQLLGEMAAAGVLMQANIKFNGALILQVFGRRPGQAGGGRGAARPALRATATVVGEVARRCQPGARWSTCTARAAAPSRSTRGTACPASSPTRAWCRCTATSASRCSACRRCSSTTCCRASSWTPRLVLAANDDVAAGLLIQRLPERGSTTASRCWPPR